MKFFERFRGEDETGVRDLHPDFKIHKDSWYYNRRYSLFTVGKITIKIRFSFDNPRLLDGCPFYGKIGMNKDPYADGKYIGFAYGQSKDRETLVSWAQKFNYAELIEELGLDAVSTPDSKVTPLR